jgi:hypothetical protein
MVKEDKCYVTKIKSDSLIIVFYSDITLPRQKKDKLQRCVTQAEQQEFQEKLG